MDVKILLFEPVPAPDNYLRAKVKAQIDILPGISIAIDDLRVLTLHNHADKFWVRYPAWYVCDERRLIVTLSLPLKRALDAAVLDAYRVWSDAQLVESTLKVVGQFEAASQSEQQPAQNGGVL